MIGGRLFDRERREFATGRVLSGSQLPLRSELSCRPWLSKRVTVVRTRNVRVCVLDGARRRKRLQRKRLRESWRATETARYPYGPRIQCRGDRETCGSFEVGVTDSAKHVTSGYTYRDCEY